MARIHARKRAHTQTTEAVYYEDMWPQLTVLQKEFTERCRGVRMSGAAAANMCHLAMGEHAHGSWRRVRGRGEQLEVALLGRLHQGRDVDGATTRTYSAIAIAAYHTFGKWKQVQRPALTNQTPPLDTIAAPLCSPACLPRLH